MSNQFNEEQFKKMLFRCLPYIFLAYFFAKIAEVYNGGNGNLLARVLFTFQHMDNVFVHPGPTFTFRNLLSGITAAASVRLYVYLKSLKKKNFRQGKEYGSARWGSRKEIAPYTDEKFYRNIILSETEFLTMNSRMKNPLYNRNKNILIIGGSGSGKTRFFAKPNLMQLHSSYVVTDPKGSVITECGHLFQTAGYQIKIINLINFKKSMHYNPFQYIRCEADIITFSNTLIVNTTRKGASSADPFWEEAEKLLYNALIGYIFYEAPESEKNILTLIEIVDAIEVRDSDEGFKSAVDLLFEELEQENLEREQTKTEPPSWFPVRQWKKFKKAAGKTAKSILICAGSRLSPFDIDEVRELMRTDDLELDMLGDRKSVLFIVVPDTDKTFNFIAALMYSQMFKILCTKADEEYGGRLPIPIRFILDEFANMGQIPDFEILIATIRSREMSASIIVQTKSQLKAIYKDNAETIEGNCDTTIFLGGKEKTTLKDIEEALGSETVDLFNESEQRSNTKTYGLNYNKTGRKLMAVDEINVMPRDKCIVQLSGVRPFLSNKYDITKHPRYKYLSDFNTKNTFKSEKYIKSQQPGNLKLRPDDEVEIFDVGTMKGNLE